MFWYFIFYDVNYFRLVRNYKGIWFRLSKDDTGVMFVHIINNEDIEHISGKRYIFNLNKKVNIVSVKKYSETLEITF